MNYLAGLTYPYIDPVASKMNGGGLGMTAPFCKLTIGQMFIEAPGYISALTYTVQDNGTWETTFAKLPKYIQVSCTFTHIGKRLPAAEQKHFELPWVAEQEYQPDASQMFLQALNNPALFKGIGSRLDLGKVVHTDFNKEPMPQLGLGDPPPFAPGKPPPAFGKSNAAKNAFGLGQTFTLG